MGGSAAQNVGTAARAGLAVSTLGQSELIRYGYNKLPKEKSQQELQAEQALAERNRLKGLMTDDNLQYFTKEEQERYRKGLDLQQGQIAPQDELGYYKTKADELELAVANNRERAKLTQEQIKLLRETPGAKQTKNPEYLLQNATANADSILTAGQKAENAAKKGSILT